MKNNFKKIITTSIILAFFIIAFTPMVSSNNAINIKSDKISIQGFGDTEYYAVIAGCAHYEDPGANLPVQTEKMKNIYRGLISNDNWHEGNIRLLMDEDATRNNILGALDEMAGLVDDNDVFLFSWQGHGAVVNGEGNPDETKDEVICPWDCGRDSEGNLVNYITDDELGAKFDAIGGEFGNKAEGMVIIIESCFSGGMDDTRADVGGPGRIVITSTIRNFLGRASWIFGFPMTWTIGEVLDKNSLFNIQDSGFFNDAPSGDIIGMEDVFDWAQPKIFVQNSLLWGAFWTWMFFVNLDLHFDEDGNLLFDETLAEAIEAAKEATKFIFQEFCLIQVQAIFMSGFEAWGMLNCPMMTDDYNDAFTPFKNEKLTIVDNTVKDETRQNTNTIDVPMMPDIWHKPSESTYNAFSQETRDGLSDIGLGSYDSLYWGWENINEDFWPPLQVEAKKTGESKPPGRTSAKIVVFEANAVNGPDITYNWNFGDGSTYIETPTDAPDGAYDGVATHTYSDGKVRSAKLTIIDGEGRSLTIDVEPESKSKALNLFDMLFIKNNFIKLFFQFFIS